MQYNFRLDDKAYTTIAEMRMHTGRSFSDIARGLIINGVMGHDILDVRGATTHIIGVDLEPPEVLALRTLCNDHGVKHSDCMRMLLAACRRANGLPMTPADALRALKNGRADLVEQFIALQHAVHPMDDGAPRDRKLLLWIPGHKYWTIGNWDDDRFSMNPKPFWRHDGETITFSRNNPPSHYTAVPPDVRDD
jgi:hypothetical protein